MTIRRAHFDVINRFADDGAPFQLWRETGEDDRPEGLLVETIACSNPDCACTEMELLTHDLVRSPDGRALSDRRDPGWTTLDMATGRIRAGRIRAADPGAAANPAVLAWLREEVRGRLKVPLWERWTRIKGHEDREQWREQDRATLTVDWLVAYCEVFPRDWDLMVVLDGRTYWAIDSYCLRPGCKCKEVMLAFHRMGTDVPADDNTMVGAVKTALDKWRNPEIEGGELTHRLWSEFISLREIKQDFRRRYKEMKRVAGELAQERRSSPAALQQAGVGRQQHTGRDKPRKKKIGRNEPCPCGSGKKYKKCCRNK